MPLNLSVSETSPQKPLFADKKIEAKVKWLPTLSFPSTFN